MFTLGSFGQVPKAVHQSIDIGKLISADTFFVAVQAESQCVLMHSFLKLLYRKYFIYL